jgi:hypothetical protein
MASAGGMAEVHERHDLASAPLRLWLGPLGPFTEQVVSRRQHRWGGAKASTEGTRVGSASRSSSYPIPARPVIKPGDSTPNGLPQRQPF